ncbi:hypothetical protein [Phenylobacterium sp.]|uniref:hypothetical protein n=1 Tax=Phenylobacterium sp. TaxID=1871053 RepID=UPI00301C776C
MTEQAALAVEIFIPSWHPAKLNEILSGHWSKGHKLKKRDRQLVWAYSQKAARAVGKRRLELTIILKKGQRGADPDAYFKSLCDALKQEKLLVDDNRQGVELMPVRYEKAAGDEWGSVIRLWDVQPA